MAQWEKHYHQNTLHAEKAINKIQSNKKVVVSSFCSEPTVLVKELVKQKERLVKTYIYTMTQGGNCEYASKEHKDFFKTYAFIAAPIHRDSFKAKNCDYLPINMSQIPRWLNENIIDVVLIQVATPDDNGYCSLGISVDFMKAAVEKGKLIIAEVNESMPVTYGDTKISVEKINYFVQVNHSLNTTEIKEITDVDRRIGENVAEIIPHRAAFQIGVGSIAESVFKSLKGKVDLSVHTGTFSDGMKDLIENGVVTNKYKTINPGKVISTSLTGTKELYDYVHKNINIELHQVNYTHNIKTMAQIDQLYSINSALEVDVTGQVNAEKLGNIQIAGVGGQMDFIQGSKVSKGGRSIIALPSTAKNDTISRVKMKIATVTTLKTEVDYFVTENGIAKLFGKSLEERLREIANVAHPDFCKDLIER